MSTSHHGNPHKDQSEIMQRLLDQFENRARREYTNGRVGADDEGSLALAVAADPQHGIVRVTFGKPVDWLGCGRRDVPQRSPFESDQSLCGVQWLHEPNRIILCLAS